jgi:predicted O-methyltransferase YrrM
MPVHDHAFAMCSAVDLAIAQGAFQHREELLDFLEWYVANVMAADSRIGPVLEIGAHRGGTAVLFCELGAERVVTVDLPNGRWGGLGNVESLQRGADLRLRYPRQYVDVLGDSHSLDTLYRVQSILLGKRLELLFIDGDHSYAGVKQDYEMYKDLVRPGGCIAFHDINDTEFHWEQGVEVPRFWKELEGEKIEFSAKQGWGGIGALRA